MKNITVISICLGFLFLTGCASQMPNFALTQPEQGMTVMHPDQLEKAGGKIFNFTGVVPSRFLVEMDKSFSGVFPFVGVSLKDENAPMVKGFCYSVPSQAFGDKNPWAMIPAQCVGLGDKDDMLRGEYAFAVTNKDGGVWLASPIGAVPGYEYTIVDEQTYDWAKFEKEPKYRIELMKQLGKTIPVINDTWKKRIEGFGVVMTTDDVQEIAVVDGDPKWEAFRKKMLSDIGYQLKLPDGEIVASYLSEEDMEKLLAKNPLITPWQKFVSRLRLPLGGTPGLMGLGALSSMVDGSIASFMDTAWESMTARGMCQRKDFSEQFELLLGMYQKAHIQNMTGGM
ncbi:MAG: hypothetical protein WC819_02095 [Parcubacteria group bacterium]|jgi:hypothetical protein